MIKGKLASGRGISKYNTYYLYLISCCLINFSGGEAG